MSITEIFALSLGAILIENYIFVKFLGICSFLGVSKKMDTAFGMGMAVVFVMTVSSAVTYVVNRFILVPLNIGYMQTVAFILVIASLVQFVEMLLMKMMPSVPKISPYAAAKEVVWPGTSISGISSTPRDLA